MKYHLNVLLDYGISALHLVCQVPLVPLLTLLSLLSLQPFLVLHITWKYDIYRSLFPNLSLPFSPMCVAYLLSCTRFRFWQLCFVPFELYLEWQASVIACGQSTDSWMNWKVYLYSPIFTNHLLLRPELKDCLVMIYNSFDDMHVIYNLEITMPITNWF